MAPPTHRIAKGLDSSPAQPAPLRGRGGPALKPDAFARTTNGRAASQHETNKPTEKSVADRNAINGRASEPASGVEKKGLRTDSQTERQAPRKAPARKAERAAASTDAADVDLYGLRSIFRPVRDNGALLSALKPANANKPRSSRAEIAHARAINARANETLQRLKRFERRARTRVVNKVESARASIASAFAGQRDETYDLEAAARGRTISNRIERLCELDRDEVECVRTFAMSEPRIHQSGSEIVGQRERSPDPMFISSGWACRVRILSGGRRQIIGFLLPGDPIGLRGAAEPDAPTSIGAITQVESIDARGLLAQVERSNRYPGLERAIQRADAQEKEFLMNQVVRLGSMNPTERLEDLLRELKWRLRQVRLADDKQFQLPLSERDFAATLNLHRGELRSAMKKLRRQHGFRVRRNVAQLAELGGETGGQDGFFGPPSISRAPGLSPLPRIISS